MSACRKKPPEGDKHLEQGRAYDGVRVLSIKPAQTRRVLRAHGSEGGEKYRTATRPAELRVIVAENGKKAILKDGVVGELSTETQNSMVWRKQENQRQGETFRAAKRSFVRTHKRPPKNPRLYIVLFLNFHQPCAWVADGISAVGADA